MPDFLKQMSDLSLQRADAADRSLPENAFDKPVFPLCRNGFDIIAEIKDKSPSEGVLTSSARSRAEQASLYRQGGAAAISVLTEPTKFAGDLAHLEEVVALVEGAALPVMRKDFLVDVVQVLEARASGASGVLLITAMLSDGQLAAMLDCASEHSLFVLLEAFDEDDLRRTAKLLEQARHADRAASGQLLVGVNTRNLRTLEVATGRLEKLAALLPAAAIAVAESGLHTPADAEAARRLGYQMALVGTAFMRSDKPADLLQSMLAAGRAV